MSKKKSKNQLGDAEPSTIHAEGWTVVVWDEGGFWPFEIPGQIAGADGAWDGAYVLRPGETFDMSKKAVA